MQLLMIDDHGHAGNGEERVDCTILVTGTVRKSPSRVARKYCLSVLECATDVVLLLLLLLLLDCFAKHKDKVQVGDCGWTTSATATTSILHCSLSSTIAINNIGLAPL